MRRGWQGLDESNQNVQTSSYKIHKYKGSNAQHDKYNEHCYMLYIKVVKRVSRKSPPGHKEKNFFSISLTLYERMDAHYTYW